MLTSIQHMMFSCQQKKCYPYGVHVSDISAEVPLQNLVDHTIARIVEAHSNAFQNINIDAQSTEKVTAIYKWGCDGSSGHATYRQSFSDAESMMTDEYLLAICIVPLQVLYGSTVLWKNSRPSSTRYCRPIKILCRKENADLVRVEVDNVNAQIVKIKPTSVHNFHVHHNFHMTMIDGKTFSVIAESSSQTCGICKATPKIMNDLNMVQTLACDEQLFKFGLSTLHAWIRCFECILHIAYRLPIKKMANSRCRQRCCKTK